MLDYRNAICICFVYVFIELCSCTSDKDATDGDIHLQRIMNGEALTTPPMLIFTAPSKICKPEYNGTCKGKRLALSFPLIIGKNAADQFQKHFPRNVTTVDPELTTRPTFTTSIKYCVAARRCFQNGRRRATPLDLLSSIIRVRRSILDHPENFLDTVTRSAKSHETTPQLTTHHQQHYTTERSVNTPHITQIKSHSNITSGKLLIEVLNNYSSKFIPRSYAHRMTSIMNKNISKNASPIEPYRGIYLKKHSKLLKKVTDLFGYQDVEPYKHLEYPPNKKQTKLSMQYKKNIKKYLAKLERNKYKNIGLVNTGKNHRLVAKTHIKFVNKNTSEYPPIKGIKAKNQDSDYDEHRIRNSADVSKENFEEMSLPEPDNISDRDVEVKRIQREGVEPINLKRFKIKDNNNNDVSAGNSKKADLDKKPLRDDHTKIKKIIHSSKQVKNPITKKPQIITSTYNYKLLTLSYIKDDDYKKATVPTQDKPYRYSTKQSTDYSNSTIVTQTPYSNKQIKILKNVSSTATLKKKKTKFYTVSERNKIITIKKPYKESPRKPNIQVPSSESAEESDASENDLLREKPLIDFLNPSSSERERPKNHKGYVSDVAQNKLYGSDSAGESESSQSHQKVSYTSGSARDTSKKRPELKQQPQKYSSSESSEINDVSNDVPNTSSDYEKPHLSNINKMRSKIYKPQKVFNDIPPNDHNKYIPYVHKLMKVPNIQSPSSIKSTQSVKTETQTESVPKEVMQSEIDTKIQEKVSSIENRDSDNDKIAEILRDLLRESRNSLDAPDIVRIPNEIKIRKSKLTTKRSRDKHPEVYIMVV